MLVHDEIIYIFSYSGEAGKDNMYVGKTPRSVSQCGVRFSTALLNFGLSKNLEFFCKNQHVGFSFSEIFSSNASQGGVRLLAVLVGTTKSLISRISPRKQIFQQNHYSLFTKGPGVQCWGHATFFSSRHRDVRHLLNLCATAPPRHFFC